LKAKSKYNVAVQFNEILYPVLQYKQNIIVLYLGCWEWKWPSQYLEIRHNNSKYYSIIVFSKGNCFPMVLLGEV